MICPFRPTIRAQNPYAANTLAYLEPYNPAINLGRRWTEVLSHCLSFDWNHATWGGPLSAESGWESGYGGEPV